MCMHTHVHTLTYTHMGMYACTHIYTYTRMHTQLCMHTHMYTCIYAHTCKHRYVCMYTHTHVHAHTYTHTYIHVFFITYITLSLFFLSPILQGNKVLEACCQEGGSSQRDLLKELLLFLPVHDSSREQSTAWSSDLCPLSHQPLSGTGVERRRELTSP